LKLNNEEEYADILIPNDPEVAGRVTEAETGVCVIPVPSDAIEDDKVA
jgi:hypothetical protein